MPGTLYWFYGVQSDPVQIGLYMVALDFLNQLGHAARSRRSIGEEWLMSFLLSDFKHSEED